MSRTAVVILNWNGEALLKEFLPVVISNSVGFDVVVVDNYSTDNSVKLLQREFPEVILLLLDKNYGFAGGYNRAISQLNYENVILLNSDVAPAKGWIEPLVAVLAASEKISVVAPKIMDYKNPAYFEYAGAAGGFIDYLGYPFCRGRIFDTVEVDEHQYDNSVEIFWASGAAFAVKRSVYLEVGGLDEDFFAHQEEIDLCWRIQRWGGVIKYVPTSCVYHLGGGTLNQGHPRKTYLNFRNGLFMILKNQDSETLYRTLFLRMLLDGVAAIKFLVSFDWSNFWAIFKSHIHFYQSFKLFYQKRMNLIDSTDYIAHQHIFKKSIVLQYFMFRKKRYTDL